MELMAQLAMVFIYKYNYMVFIIYNKNNPRPLCVSDEAPHEGDFEASKIDIVEAPDMTIEDFKNNDVSVNNGELDIVSKTLTEMNLLEAIESSKNVDDLKEIIKKLI